MTLFTYFAWSDELQLMKIGRSTRPAKRMITLTGKPYLVALVESENLPEAEAHEAFSDHRKHGEWFDISEAHVSAYLAQEEIPLVDLSGPIVGRMKHINITLGEDVFENLRDMAAKCGGRSISSLIREACAEKLDRDAATETQTEEASV